MKRLSCLVAIAVSCLVSPFALAMDAGEAVANKVIDESRHDPLSSPQARASRRSGAAKPPAHPRRTSQTLPSMSPPRALASSPSHPERESETKKHAKKPEAHGHR